MASDGSVAIACPCGVRGRAAATLAGRRVRCARCGASLRVRDLEPLGREAPGRAPSDRERAAATTTRVPAARPRQPASPRLAPPDSAPGASARAARPSGSWRRRAQVLQAAAACLLGLLLLAFFGFEASELLGGTAIEASGLGERAARGGWVLVALVLGVHGLTRGTTALAERT